MNIWAKIKTKVYAVVVEVLMEKIDIQNDLGLMVYVNGKPNLSLISQDVMDVLCAALLSLMETELKKVDE